MHVADVIIIVLSACIHMTSFLLFRPYTYMQLYWWANGPFNPDLSGDGYHNHHLKQTANRTLKNDPMFIYMYTSAIRLNRDWCHVRLLSMHAVCMQMIDFSFMFSFAKKKHPVFTLHRSFISTLSVRGR